MGKKKINTKCPLEKDSKEKYLDIIITSANGFSGTSDYSDCVQITLEVNLIVDKRSLQKRIDKSLTEEDLKELIEKRK
jgi:hypothetical protein